MEKLYTAIPNGRMKGNIFGPGKGMDQDDQKNSKKMLGAPRGEADGLDV
jgi:hypothetical protein